MQSEGKEAALFVVYFTEVTYSRSTGENEQVSRSQQRGKTQTFVYPYISALLLLTSPFNVLILCGSFNCMSVCAAGTCPVPMELEKRVGDYLELQL